MSNHIDHGLAAALKSMSEDIDEMKKQLEPMHAEIMRRVSDRARRNGIRRYALVQESGDSGVKWSVGGVWTDGPPSNSSDLMTGPQADAFQKRHPNARIVDVIVFLEAHRAFVAGVDSVLDHSQLSTPEMRKAAREAGIKALVQAGFPEDALDVTKKKAEQSAPGSSKQQLFADEAGNRVEVLWTSTADMVEFSAQGDGFVQKLPRADFERRFKPIAVPAYSLIAVSAEWLPPNMEVLAYSNGQRWNGWAMPCFTIEAARSLLEFIPELRYDSARDAFTWKADDGQGEEELYGAETHVVDGRLVKTYAIGAGSWCWEFAEQPDESADELPQGGSTVFTDVHVDCYERDGAPVALVLWKGASPQPFLCLKVSESGGLSRTALVFNDDIPEHDSRKTLLSSVVVLETAGDEVNVAVERLQVFSREGERPTISVGMPGEKAAAHDAGPPSSEFPRPRSGC